MIIFTCMEFDFPLAANDFYPQVKYISMVWKETIFLPGGLAFKNANYCTGKLRCNCIMKITKCVSINGFDLKSFCVYERNREKNIWDLLYVRLLTVLKRENKPLCPSLTSSVCSYQLVSLSASLYGLISSLQQALPQCQHLNSGNS